LAGIVMFSRGSVVSTACSCGPPAGGEGGVSTRGGPTDGSSVDAAHVELTRLAQRRAELETAATEARDEHARTQEVQALAEERVTRARALRAEAARVCSVAAGALEAARAIRDPFAVRLEENPSLAGPTAGDARHAVRHIVESGTAGCLAMLYGTRRGNRKFAPDLRWRTRYANFCIDSKCEGVTLGATTLAVVWRSTDQAGQVVR